MASLVPLVLCVWVVMVAVVIPPSTPAASPYCPPCQPRGPPSIEPECHKVTILQGGQTFVKEQLASVLQQLAKLQSLLKVCPAGWSAHGDSCFQVVAEELTADGASKSCEHLDPRARLATLHPDHREHVHDLVDSSPFERVWIGLSRVPSGDGYGADGWQWSDGSMLEGDAPWLPNQPDNNGGEDCVQYDRTHRYPGWTKGWSDERCVLTASFVCQISMKC